ncbi:MAG: hypothetical protein JNK05_10435 [Myxococcales bacterium]|nr:hypothetical protein [Myxococcales bacterium]
MTDQDRERSSERAFRSLYSLDLHSARKRLLAAFERAYVQRLLDRVGGNVAAAARIAQVDRVTLFRMLKRHGIRIERGASIDRLRPIER